MISAFLGAVLRQLRTASSWRASGWSSSGRPSRRSIGDLGRNPVSFLGARYRPAWLEQALFEIHPRLWGTGHPGCAGLASAGQPADQRPDRGLFHRLAEQGYRGLLCQSPLLLPSALLCLAVAGCAIVGRGRPYALLRWLGGLLWKEDALTSVLIFFLRVLPSFPIYMFLYGLFGGWDRDTLAELKSWPA